MSVASDPRARWAAPALHGSSRHTETFDAGLPVGLIATPRHQFVWCSADEKLSTVLARETSRFDHLPVVNGEDLDRPIIGLLDTTKFRNAPAPDEAVGNVMSPLTEENLIGADAGLLAFVRDADRHECRLVVSGGSIAGLVTLSDLQQLPVRAALFTMVTLLEITMAEAIRAEAGVAGTWTDRLSPERRRAVQQSVETARRGSHDIEPLAFTQFADKVTILRKSPQFSWSKTQFKTELSAIEKLRNNLAHANSYAETRERARQTCASLRQIEAWIERLSGWPDRCVRDSPEAGDRVSSSRYS